LPNLEEEGPCRSAFRKVVKKKRTVAMTCKKTLESAHRKAVHGIERKKKNEMMKITSGPEGRLSLAPMRGWHEEEGTAP